jgi:hypothetical protein
LFCAGAQVQLGDQVVDDALEEVLPAVDVAVDRHRLDAELLAQSAHRQRGQAVLIDKGNGSRHNPFTSQAARTWRPRSRAVLTILVRSATHRSPPKSAPRTGDARPALAIVKDVPFVGRVEQMLDTSIIALPGRHSVPGYP